MIRFKSHVSGFIPNPLTYLHCVLHANAMTHQFFSVPARTLPAQMQRVICIHFHPLQPHAGWVFAFQSLLWTSLGSFPFLDPFCLEKIPQQLYPCLRSISSCSLLALQSTPQVGIQLLFFLDLRFSKGWIIFPIFSLSPAFPNHVSQDYLFLNQSWLISNFSNSGKWPTW